MLQVNRIDHLVLTVKDIATTVDFYTTVLGMNTVIFGENRVALTFGDQKINLHQRRDQGMIRTNGLAEIIPIN